jgi:hypothetical protein
MSKFCVNLKFNVKLFKENFDPFSLRNLYHEELEINKFVHKELIEFLSDYGVAATALSTFYCKPHYNSIIHADQGAEQYNWDYAKINFAFGGSDSVMNWYKPLTPPKTTKDHLGGRDGGNFNRWKIEDLELINQEWVGFPGICQVGIPHNITTKSEQRRCMSLHIGNIKTNKRLQFEETVEIFKNFQKNE